MNTYNGTTQNKINQDEINAVLWKACDTFRGTIDPSEYKNYILVMLFLKYISDVWQEHYETERTRSGTDDDGMIRRRLRHERFVLPPNCDYDTIYAKRNSAESLGEVINIALQYIEDYNKEKLEGVFRNIDFNSEAALGRTRQRNDRLKNLLEDFHDPRLDMRPSRIGNLDVIGNAYEYLIGRFASGAGKKAGEFYTPPEVSTLLAQLLDPQPGERIYDPACGSGSLLIKCVNQVDDPNYAVYGQEANGSTWALCMMNMFLHNVNVSRDNIRWGDTLNEPLHTDSPRELRRFHVVVANPPFSLDKWGAEHAANDPFNRFQRGIPPKSKGDYAFISHMIESTYNQPGDDGRVGVIVPHGVLFRGGSEGTIRQRLIDENLLDAVIGLPPNLFYGTGIPAAILLFRRQKRDDSVLFIDASREFIAGTNQNILRVEDIEKIKAVYKERRNIHQYSYVATRSEIAGNNYNLNMPRYVDTFETKADIDLATVNGKIVRLREELATLEVQMQYYLEELGLDG